MDEVVELFAHAYYKSATAQNAILWFSATGIWPFNLEIIPEEGYTYLQGSKAESARALEDTHNQLRVRNNETNGHEKDIAFSDITPMLELHAAKCKRGESSHFMTISPYKRMLELDKNTKTSNKSTKSKMHIMSELSKRKEKKIGEKQEIKLGPFRVWMKMKTPSAWSVGLVSQCFTSRKLDNMCPLLALGSSRLFL